MEKEKERENTDHKNPGRKERERMATREKDN